MHLYIFIQNYCFQENYTFSFSVKAIIFRFYKKMFCLEISLTSTKCLINYTVYVYVVVTYLMISMSCMKWNHDSRLHTCAISHSLLPISTQVYSIFLHLAVLPLLEYRVLNIDLPLLWSDFFFLSFLNKIRIRKMLNTCFKVKRKQTDYNKIQTWSETDLTGFNGASDE